MVVPDALRVVAGAGAATAVGFVYYNPALPSGQIFIAQMKKSGKALEFDGQTKVALATSVACAAGLAALYVARAGDKTHTLGELAHIAGRLTLMCGALELPHSLFERRGLPLFLVHRGYDFAAILAITATVNALR